MPSASQHVWDKYKELFETDTADDGPATAYLESQGWVLSRDWTWRKPGTKRDADIPEKDRYAILFLAEEWDYGTVVFDDTIVDVENGYTQEQIEEMNKTLGNQGG